MDSSEYERFDGVFTAVASGVKGIEPLMDAFFGFLGRKTDFYQADLQNQEDVARRVTLTYFEKHRETALKRFKEEKEKNKALDEKRKRKNDLEQQKLEEFRKQQEKLQKAPRVEEVFDEQNEEEDKNKEKHPNGVQHSSVNGTLEKGDDNNDGEKEHGPPPVGNGGKTDRYVWTQTLNCVDVLIEVPPGTTARQCNITMTATKLKIEINRMTSIDGVFHAPIKVDSSIWTLEDNRILHLTLEKKEGMRWWTCVLKGDPEINTQQIVPEVNAYFLAQNFENKFFDQNSKISDLDDDLRQTVEKMMYDQEMKAKGLPTSAQSKQAAILEQFKKQHPELDFSNAKINWGGDNASQFNM